MASKPAALKTVPKKTSARPSVGLLERLATRATELSEAATRVYSRVKPVVDSGLDIAWAVGTTALLLYIPIAYEIQRETTVRVMQKQRELEINAATEQAKMANAGILENLGATASMLMGKGPGGQ